MRSGLGDTEAGWRSPAPKRSLKHEWPMSCHKRLAVAEAGGKAGSTASSSHTARAPPPGQEMPRANQPAKRASTKRAGNEAASSPSLNFRI